MGGAICTRASDLEVDECRRRACEFQFVVSRNEQTGNTAGTAMKFRTGVFTTEEGGGACCLEKGGRGSL